MNIQSVTDIGSTRRENQDNYWSALLNTDGSETGIVCICDGMGGLDNGGLASSIAVKTVRDCILEGTDFEELYNVLSQVNKNIYSLSSEGNRMGTTCTVLYCKEGKYSLLHVGDSRCYHIYDNSVEQVTEDNSVIAEYGITKENNRSLYEKYKSKLTRCLGVKPDVEISRYNGNYKDGESFLLCSDGFWHYFEESGKSLRLENLEECIRDCMDVYGEQDNITACLLYV